MINLLVGKYGSGKSTHIFNCIKEDFENGIFSFLIVPEQYSVACERMIASKLPPKAQLSCEVLNFSRLANRVFREFGGLKYNYVTNSAKNLIMYIAVSQVKDRLKAYKIANGHEKSCITLFLQAIYELKSYNISMDTINKVKDHKNTSEHLRNKLEDITAVWSAYENLLNDRFSDPLNDMQTLAQKLEGMKYFKDCNVYIDSFYGFTGAQYKILSYIIRDAKNVTLAFDCPTDIKSANMQYAKIVQSVKDIMKICNKQNKEFKIAEGFDKDYKHTSEDIKYICDNLWCFTADKKETCNDIKLVSCKDEFDECEYVAGAIRQLIEEGNQYSDIAIIARNSNTYRGILDYTLKKFNIPYFFSAPSDLLGMPVIKMVFTALTAISTYKPEDIIAYTKCGYSDIDELSISMLEEYMTRWDIYGSRFSEEKYWGANPDGFVLERTESQKNRLTTILKARKQIISMLSILEKPFSQGQTVKECAIAIHSFLEAHDIINKLEKEMAESSKEDAYIIAQVYKALWSSLDTLVDICGDFVITPSTFATLLHYALVDEEISTIPTGEDNVLIADASMVRASSIKHVFLIGANESVFPASIKDSSFFNDNDKDELIRLNSEINLSEKTEIRIMDELMFFSNSIAIASSSATICSLDSGIMGEKKQPSVAFTRIRDLFEGLEVDFPSNNVIDKIYTIENATEYYNMADDKLKKVIANSLGSDKDKIKAGSFTNDRQIISDNMLKAIYNSDEIKLTQSAIEKFQSCHLSYYANYLLKLRSNRKFDFSSIEIGNLFHYVFEHITTHIRDLNRDYKGLTDEYVSKRVSELVSNYINMICMGAFQTNKLKHLFGKMEKNLQILTKKIVDEFKQSSFIPKFFELNFDGDGIDTPLPLEIPISDGTRAILHGKPDRVDIYNDGKNTYVRIVDYKTGKKEFNMADFENGTMLQLFIYLFALCEMKDCKFKSELLNGSEKILPAGAYYLPLKVGKAVIDSDLLSDPLDASNKCLEEVKNNAFPNGRFLKDENLHNLQDRDGLYLPSFKSSKSYISKEEFDNLLDKMKTVVNNVVCSMKSGDASAIPLEDDAFFSTCDFCENKAFCRRRK
ncbi:MAG: PD-(D/E)XK nuclease family protein [Clostridia bacterium]|nr:PD-(D/E)XK nuclease family protein [Clostridia bacterium]